MHQLARRMAGSRDLRKVENERTRLSKIVRENPDVYDRTAAVRPHRECRPRGVSPNVRVRRKPSRCR
jgi:hypothetical protein